MNTIYKIHYKITKRIKFFKNVPGRIRTYDLRIRNPSLYPTELRARDINSIWHCVSKSSNFMLKMPSKIQLQLFLTVFVHYLRYL